jgi:hypothetical protein
MRTRLRFAQWAAALIVATIVAKGDAELAKDSPFLASGASAAPGGPSSDGRSPELRGIMSSQDGIQYCIYDPQKKASIWMGLHEAGHPFVVTSADPDNERVTLQTSDGQRLSLTLKQSKVSGQPAGPAAPAQAAAADIAGLSPEQLEQRRKNDVLREEMAQKRRAYTQAVRSGLIPAVPPQN